MPQQEFYFCLSKIQNENIVELEIDSEAEIDDSEYNFKNNIFIYQDEEVLANISLKFFKGFYCSNTFTLPKFRDMFGKRVEVTLILTESKNIFAFLKTTENDLKVTFELDQCKVGEVF